MRYLACLYVLVLLSASCKKSGTDASQELLARAAPKLAGTYTWRGTVSGGYQPPTSITSIPFDSTVIRQLPIVVINNSLIVFNGDTLPLLGVDTRTNIIIYGNGAKNPNPSLTYYTDGDSMTYYEEIYQVNNGADLYQKTLLSATR